MTLVLCVEGKNKSWVRVNAIPSLLTKNCTVLDAIKRMKVVHKLDQVDDWEIFIKVKSKMK
jgi:hypothetical protein